MDVISQAFDRLNHQEPISSLPHLSKLLGFLEKHPSSHWLLPARICQAVGGDEVDAVSIVAANIALHTGVVMIDDLLDQDNRFDRFSITTGDRANYASAFFAAAYSALMQCSLPRSAQYRMMEYLTACIAMTAQGQDLDTHSEVSNEADYWQISHLKSSPFFSAAFYLGALAGNASQDLANDLKQIGGIYGEMVQIHDDVKDCFSVPASRDWCLDRYPLPVLHAHLVDYPDREIFASIHPEIQDIRKLRQAQTLLLRCGAVGYCIYCLIQRSEKIESLASSLSLPNPKPFHEVLSTVIRPAYQLLEKFQTS